MQNQIKISHEIPPIYFKLREKFNVSWENGLAITIDDTIFCKFKLNQDVAIHEMVHIEQQKKIGVDEWWKKYLNDISFRRSQEIEAYRMQADWIKKNVGDRNKKFVMLRKICKDLSSPMYAIDLPYEEIVKIVTK